MLPLQHFRAPGPHHAPDGKWLNCYLQSIATLELFSGSFVLHLQPCVSMLHTPCPSTNRSDPLCRSLENKRLLEPTWLPPARGYDFLSVDEGGAPLEGAPIAALGSSWGADEGSRGA